MTTVDREALARVIWETSRKDEGTISATGANIIADALLATVLAPDGPVIRAAKAEALRAAATDADEIQRIGTSQYRNVTEDEVQRFRRHPLSDDDFCGETERLKIAAWLRDRAAEIEAQP